MDGNQDYSYCEVQAEWCQCLSKTCLESPIPMWVPVLCGLSPSKTSAHLFTSCSLFSLCYQCLSQTSCPGLYANERAATVFGMCLPHKQYQVPFLNCLPGIISTWSSFINFPIALFSLFVIISVNI